MTELVAADGEAQRPSKGAEEAGATAAAERHRLRLRRLTWARRGIATRSAARHPDGLMAAAVAGSVLTARMDVDPAPVHRGVGPPGWRMNVEVIERERIVRGWT